MSNKPEQTVSVIEKTSGSADLYNHFENEKEEICGLIERLVEIESPTGDVKASSLIADLIEKELSVLGNCRIERIAAEGYGEHLIARLKEDAKRQILLIGHSDTVHPIGTKAKNPTRKENGKFYGCGIFDMKANIGMLIAALKHIYQNETADAPGVMLYLSCDEEAGSPTGRDIVERLAAEAKICLVFEPSLNGRAKTERKGTSFYTVRAEGLAAHAGLEPERGANALAELAMQVEKIHSLASVEKGTTVNVCTFKSGTAANVIPDRAELTVDVRFTQMAEARRIDEEIRKLTPSNTKITLGIEGGINRPPLERTASENLYQKARALASELGFELEEARVGGASDGNFAAAVGAQVLDGLGIHGDGAHTLEEYIFIDDIPKRAALTAGLILQC